MRWGFLIELEGNSRARIKVSLGNFKKKRNTPKKKNKNKKQKTKNKRMKNTLRIPDRCSIL